MMTGILIVLFLTLAIVISVIIARHKKRIFNSISVGDAIHYVSSSLCEGVNEVYEFDIIVRIEYYESGEIRYIHTSKGKHFSFLNFLRDDFFLSYEFN